MHEIPYSTINLLCEIEMVWRKYATEVPVATAAAARTLIRIMIMISVYTYSMRKISKRFGGFSFISIHLENQTH